MRSAIFCSPGAWSNVSSKVYFSVGWCFWQLTKLEEGWRCAPTRLQVCALALPLRCAFRASLPEPPNYSSG